MGWHHQIVSALRRIGVATIAVVGLAPSVVRAQSQYDVFASGALAIAAYEASREQCVYSDKMGKALADIDVFLTRQDAYRWEESKRLAPDGMASARNMARMQAASDCKVYGLLIGNAAIIYFNATSFDQSVFAEFDQLLKGGGRSISGEAEAQPPQAPAPGSAAAINAELNRQFPNSNQSAYTGGRASTLRRLPADKGSPSTSLSQPPPRQSAGPSHGQEQHPSTPLSPTAPQAPPNAAMQPAPSAAPLTSDCRLAGDCRPSQATFACKFDVAAQIAQAGPNERGQAGLAAVREGSCEIVAAGRPLRIEATKIPAVVYATERGRHVGYLPVGVFAPAIAPPTLIRYTSKLSDLTVSADKSPSFAAVAVRAQGTSEASGTFRVGPKERLAFCEERWGEENTNAFSTCFREPDTTLNVKADCSAKRISLDGRRYELRERPSNVPADHHVDQTRQWLFRDLTTGEWLDGTTVSNEATVSTAFSALCPGTNPAATSGVVYRNSTAQFPHELRGRWFADRRACTDAGHHQQDYEGHAWMEFGPQTRIGAYEYEFPQRMNAVRSLGRGVWEIDGSHQIDDAMVLEIFETSTYRMTRDGFELRQQGHVSKWMCC